MNKKAMKCNVPRREVQGGKKFVVKACQNGQERIVRFGDAKPLNEARAYALPPHEGG